MNRRHVLLTPSTKFGYFTVPAAESNSPIRGDLRVGSCVAVLGRFDSRRATATADLLYLRKEHDLRVGKGLITRETLINGAHLYRADGFLVQLKPSTKITYPVLMHYSLADLGPGFELQYRGTVGPDGVIDATELKFVCPGQCRSKNKLTRFHEDAPDPLSAAGANGGDPHETVQQRVARIGMSLVPGYQKAMTSDDDDKVSFTFTVANQKIAGWYSATKDSRYGNIQVSELAIDQLHNDSQVAALLAQAIAEALQTEGRAMNSLEMGQNIAVAPLEVPKGPERIAEMVGDGELLLETKYQDAVCRIALALMSDAGYDVRQAPETWRILSLQDPKTNLDSQPYPLRSGYELNMILVAYPQKPEQLP